MYKVTYIISLIVFVISCNQKNYTTVKEDKKAGNIEKIEKSNSEWKSILTDEQYYIMIEKGTERPFTGKYWDVFEKGTYKCAACGFALFDSETKFDAHCGWPSFYDAIDPSRIATDDDYKMGYKRIEIMCSRCGAHLGHVFPDGPKPTGQRYCVNSVSIKLDTLPEKKK